MRAALVGLLLFVAGCATLEQLRALVQAPRFEEAEGQPAEIRLLPPGTTTTFGGAGVRIWAKVTNPNSFAQACAFFSALGCPCGGGAPRALKKEAL